MKASLLLLGITCSIFAFNLNAEGVDFTRESTFDSMTAFVSAARGFQPATGKTDLSQLFTVPELGQPGLPTTGMPVIADSTQTPTVIWSDDSQAIVFVTARPPTQTTASQVGVLFLLVQSNTKWRIADAVSFHANGKNASVAVEQTAYAGSGYLLGQDDSVSPVITVKETQGGRGYGYSQSASYRLQNSQFRRLELDSTPEVPAWNSPVAENQNWNEALLDAATMGDAKAMKEAVDHGAKENWNIRLIFAASSGDAKGVLTALQHGASPNTFGANKATSLSCAISRHHEDIVPILLNHGADPNLGIPLMDAIEIGDLPLVSLLISKGANVNKAGEFGGTSLTEAVMKNNINIAKYLLQNGALVNTADKYGNTSLSYAEKMKNAYSATGPFSEETIKSDAMISLLKANGTK